MSEPRKQSRRDVLILLGRTAALSLFPSGLIAESTAVEEPIGDASATLNAARGLIRRIVPASASHFSVELIATDNGRDVFEIEGRSGKIILRGNTGVSIASALHDYLKYFCHRQLSWWDRTIESLPTPLPAVAEKVRRSTPFGYR